MPILEDDRAFAEKVTEHEHRVFVRLGTDVGPFVNRGLHPNVKEAAKDALDYLNKVDDREYVRVRLAHQDQDAGELRHHPVIQMEGDAHLIKNYLQAIANCRLK